MSNDKEILALLDIRSEYVAMGLKLNGHAPSGDGWLPAHAVGREDNSASAAINTVTGRYKDHGGDGEGLSFFDFAAKHGGHGGDWRKARDFFAEKVGLKKSGKGKGRGKANAATKKSKLAKSAKAIVELVAMYDPLLENYCKAKPPITVEGIKKCGGCAGSVVWAYLRPFFRPHADRRRRTHGNRPMPN